MLATISRQRDSGLVEFALGYALEAERHLGQGLAAPSDPWITKNHEVLEDALTKVRTTIGEIAVTGAPEGAEVFLNGQLIGKLPLPKPLRVSQGPATIELRASGYATASFPVEVSGGKTSQVVLRLDRDVSPAVLATSHSSGTDLSQAPTSNSATTSTRTIVGWSLIGAGAAAIVGGAIVLATTDGGCGVMPGFECAHGPASKTPGWAILGAGAAAGIVGGILLLTRPKAGAEVALGPSGMFWRGEF